VREIPRTKGSKNKKTLAKEKSKEIITVNKPTVVIEEPKQKLALRLFTLEKSVHDNFIKHLLQFGDPKLYESYIVNEIMIKYVNGKIKPLQIDVIRMNEYVSAYRHVGYDPSESKEFNEADEFKSANKLVARKDINSFVQYKYPIIVDPDIKLSMLSKFSQSYVMNELLKLYIIGNITVDTRNFRLQEWEQMYKATIRRLKNKKDE
jgi:hypothetical protein